jgi:hypothetical protein
MAGRQHTLEMVDFLRSEVCGIVHDDVLTQHARGMKSSLSSFDSLKSSLSVTCSELGQTFSLIGMNVRHTQEEIFVDGRRQRTNLLGLYALRNRIQKQD